MKLRSVLLALNLVVFVLPIVGLFGLRVYDTQLVRQTQAELIGQGSVIASLYRRALLAHAALGHEVHVARDPVPIVSLEQGLGAMLPRAEDPEKAGAVDPAALLAAAELSELVESTKQQTLAGIRLLDHTGAVAGTSGNEAGASLAQREEVKRALNGESATVLRQRVASDPTPAPLSSLSRNTGWRVFVALPVVHDSRLLGVVVVSRTPMTLGGALWQDRVYLSTAVSVMLVVVLLVSLISTWLIERPVSRLRAMAATLTRGEAPESYPFRTPAELASLAEAFALMAKTLETRASYIKTFAAAVSHEFKTPLTSMRGAIELLADHFDAMDKPQREKFLAQLHGDTERLDRLVKRLLELARADTAKAERESVAAKAVLERLALQKSDAELEVQLVADASELPVSVETFETIVSSLIDNARQHARPSQGHVVVDISLCAGELTVRDNGQGVSDANAEKIFDPFFTTARERGGTGLGLNIVRALVESTGGSVALLTREGPGAVFRVRFHSQPPRPKTARQA